MAQKQPARVSDMMVYLSAIAKASKNTSGYPGLPMTIISTWKQLATIHTDSHGPSYSPNIYSQCLLGIDKSTEGRCQRCQPQDCTTNTALQPWCPPPSTEGRCPPPTPTSDHGKLQLLRPRRLTTPPCAQSIIAGQTVITTSHNVGSIHSLFLRRKLSQ